MDPTREAPPSPDGEQYGFQWKTIGTALGVFWASWIATYLLADPAPSGQSRAWAAARSAGWIFVGTMVAMRMLLGFVPRARLSSNTTFVVVWFVVLCVWWIVTQK